MYQVFLRLHFKSPKLLIKKFPYFYYSQTLSNDYYKLILFQIFNTTPDLQYTSENEFEDYLLHNLCTAWYKDYDNEFYKSTNDDIKNNAWYLTQEVIVQQLIGLRKDYSDRQILSAIKFVCQIMRHKFIDIKVVCRHLKTII